MKPISRILAGGAWLVGPAAALGQSSATVPGQDGGLLTWGVAAGLAVIVLLTGFLNPKRSHMT